MSNQVNHRRTVSSLNRRHKERPVPAMSCGGEGHNGQIGRSVWKKLSQRNERRNLKQGRSATIGKFPKKTKPVRKNSTMYRGIEWKHDDPSSVQRKNLCPHPLNPDTGE